MSSRISIAAFCFALSASAAAAATTGNYIDTFDGNDPFPGSIFPGTEDASVALYKCDDIPEGDNPFCTDDYAIEDYAGVFSITFDIFKDGEEAIGGTWSFVANVVGTLLPKYIALKAGSDYSVWDIGGLSSGIWSTAETLGSKGISHISFYDSYVPPPAEVPLPAAGLLLVDELGALAALRRRKAT